jgi:hypothetical protein
MSTTFQEFLKTKSIDPRRIITASHELESLTREDRAIRLTKRIARKSEDAAKKKVDVKKPRSGRPITQRALAAALTGKSVSGPTKTRFVRAVNKLLAIKKQDPITLHTLFPGQKKSAA